MAFPLVLIAIGILLLGLGSWYAFRGAEQVVEKEPGLTAKEPAAQEKAPAATSTGDDSAPLPASPLPAPKKQIKEPAALPPPPPSPASSFPPTPPQEEGAVSSTPPPPEPPPAESAPPAQVSENIVRYTEAGFSPASLTISKSNPVVIFKNESLSAMWVASDLHPSHQLYPSFDARGGTQSGETYRFEFPSSPASYPYHNHLIPWHTGVIIVE